MNDVEYVTGIATEAIKPCHNKLITVPQELDDSRQFSPTLATSARNLL
jgi:hypothetical protein